MLVHKVSKRKNESQRKVPEREREREFRKTRERESNEKSRKNCVSHVVGVVCCQHISTLIFTVLSIHYKSRIFHIPKNFFFVFGEYSVAEQEGRKSERGIEFRQNLPLLFCLPPPPTPNHSFWGTFFFQFGSFFSFLHFCLFILCENIHFDWRLQTRLNIV